MNIQVSFYGGIGGERETTPWKELLQRIKTVIEPDNRSGYVTARIESNIELEQRWETIKAGRFYDEIPEGWTNKQQWWTTVLFACLYSFGTWMGQL